MEGVIHMGVSGKTEKDLMEAFAGESQANRKYLAFAEKADGEGHSQAAKLFRAAAHSETVHAHKHLKFLGGILDTPGNLQGSIEGENYEFKEMYPAFKADAQHEGFDDVAEYISYVTKVENEHSELYQNVLENLGNNADSDYYVCGYCGHVHVGSAPEKCPVCGMPQSKFTKVE